MDEKERDAQEALGLNKIYRVYWEVPLATVEHHSIEINAVSDDDAKERAQMILDTFTDRQLIDTVRSNNNDDRPSLRRPHYDTTILGGRGAIKMRVEDQTAYKEASNPMSDMAMSESSGAGPAG